MVDFNPTRDITSGNLIGGSILICLGFAGLIYGVVSIRDDLLQGKLVKKNEEEH